ncbi:MAG: hypothetical protein L0G39_12900 [Chryseobacterium sp.]|nr:hypothetical protein [Chryseobacterium sp.]
MHRKIKSLSLVCILLLLLYSGCNKTPHTPDEKAKALIVKLFAARKNHTYGYEAGTFSKLDSAFTTYQDDSTYKAYADTVSHYLDMSTAAFTELAAVGYTADTIKSEVKKKQAWKVMLKASAKQTMYNDSADFYSKKTTYIKNHYRPFFKGWKITHEYKANNAFGIPVSQKTTFYFNIPLTDITGPEDIVKFARNKL